MMSEDVDADAEQGENCQTTRDTVDDTAKVTRKESHESLRVEAL